MPPTTGLHFNAAAKIEQYMSLAVDVMSSG